MTASTGTDTRYDMRPGSVVDICRRAALLSVVLPWSFPPAAAAIEASGPSKAAAPARLSRGLVSDRPIKVCLAERLPRAPQLIVLGSSRAAKVEPGLVRSLTGLRTFNASVSGGTPDDAWAYANFLHDLPGARAQGVLWFLDVESLMRSHPNPGLLATPQLAGYLSSPRRAPNASTGRRCVVRTSPGTSYSATGFRAHDFHDAAVERGVTQRRSIALSLAHYRRIYTTYRDLVPAAEHRVAQTVGLINAWGRTPVIVLTPLRPGFARSLGEPWTRMHRMVVDFLSSLAPTHRLDLIDASSISMFRGTSSAFYDGVHMKIGNVRRLVGYVVDHARMNLGLCPVTAGHPNRRRGIPRWTS